MAQIGKMLKPETWQASFDSEGRVSGFQKALKLIILGVCFSLFLLKKLSNVLYTML